MSLQIEMQRFTSINILGSSKLPKHRYLNSNPHLSPTTIELKRDPELINDWMLNLFYHHGFTKKKEKNDIQSLEKAKKNQTRLNDQDETENEIPTKV